MINAPLLAGNQPGGMKECSINLSTLRCSGFSGGWTKPLSIVLPPGGATGTMLDP